MDESTEFRVCIHFTDGVCAYRSFRTLGAAVKFYEERKSAQGNIHKLEVQQAVLPGQWILREDWTNPQAAGRHKTH